MEEMTAGANQTGKHILHVVVGRDFKPARIADLRWAVPGDPLSRGSLENDSSRSRNRSGTGLSVGN